jgi:polysaccharide biosynthesis transport protein
MGHTPGKHLVAGKDIRTAHPGDRGRAAVLDFKGKNNIVDTGGGLIGDQDLAEVNSQLILARAATAEAKARLDRINTVMQQDVTDASVADALKSEVIIKLRGQYLELPQREAIWSRTNGENHLAAVNLRTQMQELRPQHQG